jgi:hypothetical protein
VTQFTDPWAQPGFNLFMLTSILVTLVIALSLALALRSPQDEQLIARRPYNNPYSDATAARENWLG